MLESLTKEDWLTFIGDSFAAEFENSEPLQLRLMEVAGFGRRMGSPREAYSLLFKAAMQPFLPQSIYNLNHDKMGRLSIFLVPLGPETGEMRYEAVFT